MVQNGVKQFKSLNKNNTYNQKIRAHLCPQGFKISVPNPQKEIDILSDDQKNQNLSKLQNLIFFSKV